MNAKAIIYAFLGGAVVGVSAALLFAPESGEDIRKRLCRICHRKGIRISDDEVDSLVKELAGE